ncbi:DUF4232 domain-containing protein [Streptomyces sp. NPDC050738]|uniref:DUF4232 domain-containing protein n=1 Tax=Streptomyces sp. NPDC050738 TaxID=3154744 RepID=UPI00341B0278
MISIRRSVPALAALAVLTAAGATACTPPGEGVPTADESGGRPSASATDFRVHADPLPTGPDGKPTLPQASRDTSPGAAGVDCTGKQGLVITPERVNAAMGLRAMGFTLTNCGGRPLALNGYPDLRILDADRKPVTPAATPSPYEKKPAPVTLLSGESASSSVVWRNTVTDATVTATVGRYLRIAPAAGDAAQTVSSGELIDLGNTGKAQVTPWVRQRAR